MTANQPDLVKLLDEAGVPADIRKYLEARKITHVAVLAALATSQAELDNILMGPLEKGFKMSEANVFKLDTLRLPVERARLRHVWKQCEARQQGLSGAAGATPAPAALPASSSKSTKELPAGWWSLQVAKYEAVLVHGAAQIPAAATFGGRDSPWENGVWGQELLSHRCPLA